VVWKRSDDGLLLQKIKIDNIDIISECSGNAPMMGVYYIQKIKIER